MPRLNVMGELREILESALGGVPVQVDLPAERPGTVVVVRRCGGARQDALVDLPQVEVLMWAPTEAKAEELAELVGDVMSHLPFARGFCACEELEMRTDYDYLVRSPRWYALYRLKTYQPKEGKMASNNEEAKVALASEDATPAADIDPSLVTTGSPVEGGCVYTSFKAGAELPTDAVAKISTLTDLVSLGDLSTDGFTASKSITVNEFQGWHQSIVLTKVSGEKHQYKMVFIESVRSSVAKLRYGADNVETYEDGTFKQIKAVANSDVRVPLVIDELEDTGYLRRTVIPRVSIDSCDDVEHKPGGLVQYGFTFTVLKTADKPLFTIYRAKPAA